MRLFKFFKVGALTGPLARISKQCWSWLHANLQLTAVGGQCATGAKKAALRTAKLIVPGLLIVLFILETAVEVIKNRPRFDKLSTNGFLWRSPNGWVARSP